MAGIVYMFPAMGGAAAGSLLSLPLAFAPRPAQFAVSLGSIVVGCIAMAAKCDLQWNPVEFFGVFCFVAGLPMLLVSIAGLIAWAASPSPWAGTVASVVVAVLFATCFAVCPWFNSMPERRERRRCQREEDVRKSTSAATGIRDLQNETKQCSLDNVDSRKNDPDTGRTDEDAADDGSEGYENFLRVLASPSRTGSFDEEKLRQHSTEKISDKDLGDDVKDVK